MPRLTDMQLVILAAAAQRANGAVLPLAESIAADEKATTCALTKLIRHRLIAERPAGRKDAVWRENGDQALTLDLTDTGRAAIGLEPEGPPAATDAGDKPRPRRRASAGKSRTPAPPPPPLRPGTKQALLVELLQRKQGATIAEIGTACGWQPHSVRGAISGSLKKKLGLEVTSAVEPGRGRVYRIVG